MTANQDIERRLVAFFETEPSARAPGWVLESALSTIETTSQRRDLLAPWRFPTMNGLPRLAAVTMAAVIVGAVGFLLATGGGSPSPTAPGASSTKRPVPTPSFFTASTFGRPFTYVLPADVQIDYGPRNATSFEFRVPDSGGPGVSAWFVVAQAIGGGRENPCSLTSTALPLASAQAALEYLKTVPTVAVKSESAAVIDGRDASSAVLTLSPGTVDCPNLAFWMTDAEGVPDPFRDPGVYARVALLDVDGETIAIHTWATSQASDWVRWADELIGSFHFQR